MPGGDGTGPLGLGLMTGRAAGFCAGYPVPGYMNPIPGRGWSRGRGWGRGRGLGQGWFGSGYPYASPYYGGGYAYPSYGPGYGSPYGADPYYAQEITPQQESDMLKDQATAMQEELKSITDRISELESLAKKAQKKS